MNRVILIQLCIPFVIWHKKEKQKLCSLLCYIMAHDISLTHLFIYNLDINTFDAYMLQRYQKRLLIFKQLHLRNIKFLSDLPQFE